MVSFELTEEQLQLQKLARDFAQKEIKPVALELDRKADPRDCWSWDLIKKISKVGFRTLCIPTKYGGGGVDSCLTNCLIAEEFGVADGAIGTIIMNPMKISHLMAAAGTEEQKEKYLKMYCEDDEFLVSTAITEPSGGADNILPYNAPGAGLQMTAVQDGDYWILNGNKIFQNNGSWAKLIFVWARTDPTVGVSKGTTCFIVNVPTKGFSRGSVDDKLGQRIMNNCEYFFEDVRVHKSDILGQVNGGLHFLIDMLSFGDNLVNAAQLLGVARAAYEDTVAYCKQRVQGGKHLIEHQAVAVPLAEMFMEVEAARAFLWYAAWRLDNDDKIPIDTKYGSMAGSLCMETAVNVCVKAIPLWGGTGIQKETLIQKYLRDAVSSLHFDGGHYLKRIKTAALL